MASPQEPPLTCRSPSRNSAPAETYHAMVMLVASFPTLLLQDKGWSPFLVALAHYRCKALCLRGAGALLAQDLSLCEGCRCPLIPRQQAPTPRKAALKYRTPFHWTHHRMRFEHRTSLAWFDFPINSSSAGANGTVPPPFPRLRYASRWFRGRQA